MRWSLSPLALAAVVGACSTSHDAVAPPDPVATRSAMLRSLGVVASTPTVRVDLGDDAVAAVGLTDPTGATSITFALAGAHPVAGVRREGITVFAGALDGGDVAHVTRASGIEDFVFFDTHPAREEIAYDVDVTRVAGLRLVAGTLEMLDAGGAPRLRVESPWIAGADGAQHDASLSVEGCAFDTNVAAPWGRAVVAPGAPSCRVRIAWSAVPYPLVVDPFWATTGSLQDSRYGHAMVTLPSGQLLVVAGTHKVPTLGNGPALGGELFDTTTRTWASAGTFPNGRVDLALSLLPNGKVLVSGGNGGPVALLYTPGSGFVGSSTDTPQPAGQSATTLATGLVLLTGGSDNGTLTAASALYTASTDTFGMAGPLTTARADHTATLLASGKVLVAGGSGASGSLATCELYDPTANTFSPTGSMAHARASHVAMLLTDGRVLVAGGGDASGEIYDPTAGTFSPAGTMASDRVSAQAVLLQSGHVMVAAGLASSGPLASVDVFDPTTLSFASAAVLSFPRSAFTAATLATGEVLVVGGENAMTYSLDSTEVWMPGAAGTTCVANDDCLAGVCQAGICCAASTCTGVCTTCAQGTGACLTVTSMDDPDSCTGTMTCSATGTCEKKDGQTCAAGTTCASGFCVDGVCCDTACTGQCQACDVAAKPGTCAAVVGDSHGSRPRCTSFGTTCGGACNGIGTTACAFPSAVTTCSAACAVSTFSSSECDGLGACIPDSPQPCSGNLVCESATTCKTTCAADTDCASGYHCDATKCVPSALCDGNVITTPTGTTDCTPYTCEQAGICRVTCSDPSDCAAPNVCNPSGACVAPAASQESSGCGIGRSRSGSAWLGVAFAALAMLRQRRRAR